MKKITLMLVLLVLVISCNKEEPTKVTETVVLEKKIDPKTLMRPLPVGDPNLNPAWDWTTPSWSVYFQNAAGGVGQVNTLNPFTDGTQKIFGNTNPALVDMYPSQGWVLVSRDFGTPTDANPYPFILLYNKYRGVLRTCILRTFNTTTSYQRISLSFATSTTYPNLFEFASNPAKPFGDRNGNGEYSQSAVTRSGIQQWMIAEFNVQGYQPTLDAFSSINIELSEIAESSIVLSGTIQLDGTIEPQTQGLTLWDGLKNIGTLVASSATAVSQMTGASVTNAQLVQGAGTVLSAIGESVSGFTGGSAGTSYDIKLNGTINQTGTITLVAPKTSFSVYLLPQNTVAYHALQNINWGVFDFLSNRVGITKNVVRYGDTRCWRFKTTATIPVNYVTNNLVINPTIASSIADIKVAQITGSTGPINLIPLSQFDSVPRTFQWVKNCESYNYTPTYIYEIGVQITYTNGNVIYQVIRIVL